MTSYLWLDRIDKTIITKWVKTYLLKMQKILKRCVVEAKWT
jgi:hypothetical protein